MSLSGPSWPLATVPNTLIADPEPAHDLQNVGAMSGEHVPESTRRHESTFARGDHLRHVRLAAPSPRRDIALRLSTTRRPDDCFTEPGLRIRSAIARSIQIPACGRNVLE